MQQKEVDLVIEQKAAGKGAAHGRKVKVRPSHFFSIFVSLYISSLSLRPKIVYTHCRWWKWIQNMAFFVLLSSETSKMTYLWFLPTTISASAVCQLLPVCCANQLSDSSLICYCYYYYYSHATTNHCRATAVRACYCYCYCYYYYVIS